MREETKGRFILRGLSRRGTVVINDTEGGYNQPMKGTRSVVRTGNPRLSLICTLSGTGVARTSGQLRVIGSQQ